MGRGLGCLDPYGVLLWGWAGVALAQTSENADAVDDAKAYAKAIEILDPLAAQGDARAKSLDRAFLGLKIAAYEGDLAAHISLVAICQKTDAKRARYRGEKAIAMGCVFAKATMETYGLPATNLFYLCFFLYAGF